MSSPVADVDVFGAGTHHLHMMWPQKADVLALALLLLGGCDNPRDGSKTFDPVAQSSSGSAAAVSLEGRVTDAAHILSPATRAALSAKLDRFEKTTHHQMVVVTVPTLGGQDKSAFTLALFNAWGIGRKGYNDGIVVLVAPTERSARITVGFGLENILTDPACKEIMDTEMIPYFRKGNFTAGVNLGTDAIIARLK